MAISHLWDMATEYLETRRTNLTINHQWFSSALAAMPAPTEATPQPSETKPETTVKDLLPSLQSAEDRQARVHQMVQQSHAQKRNFSQ